MKAARTPAAAEMAAIAPGYSHRCSRCGCSATGPFPDSWDHLKHESRGWQAHCERCLVAAGHGEKSV